MSKKRQRTIKQQLKTQIDNAAAFMVLADIGDIVGANDSENKEQTERTRENIIKLLEGSKEKIANLVSLYYKEIDEAIEKMS